MGHLKYCRKCKQKHSTTSAIGRKHARFRRHHYTKAQRLRIMSSPEFQNWVSAKKAAGEDLPKKGFFHAFMTDVGKAALRRGKQWPGKPSQSDRFSTDVPSQQEILMKRARGNPRVEAPELERRHIRIEKEVDIWMKEAERIMNEEKEPSKRAKRLEMLLKRIEKGLHKWRKQRAEMVTFFVGNTDYSIMEMRKLIRRTKGNVPDQEIDQFIRDFGGIQRHMSDFYVWEEY